MPRLGDMLDSLNGVEIFSKIYVKSGYHQVHVCLEVEVKTAFEIKKGYKNGW